jgi:glutaredoxin
MTLPGRPNRFMPQVLVLGRDTCEDTLESRRFLTREKVPFQYLSWEHDPETEAAIRAFNDGEVVTPTIIIGDPAAPTKVLVEPTDEELDRAIVEAGGGI